MGNALRIDDDFVVSFAISERDQRVALEDAAAIIPIMQKVIPTGTSTNTLEISRTAGR
jgi:hypothetical protein